VIDYIDSEILVFVDEPKRFEQRIENLITESNEMCKSFMENGQLLAEALTSFLIAIICGIR